MTAGAPLDLPAFMAEPQHLSQLLLPWPPTINTYWRSIPMRGRVRVLISRAGRAFADEVAIAVLQQRTRRYLAERLSVEILASPPDVRTRDLDNLLKPTLDALVKAGVMLDDGQVDELTIRRGPVVRPGLLAVTIRRIPKGTP